jgi:ketosteroid isomerase-like protein
MAVNDELKSFYEEFALALDTRDLVRISRLYTDDAVFLRNGSAPITGSEQIGQLFQGPPPTTKTTFEFGDVLEDGEMILHDGDRVSRFVGVYRRQADGSLKMAVDVPMRSSSSL